MANAPSWKIAGILVLVVTGLILAFSQTTPFKLLDYWDPYRDRVVEYEAFVSELDLAEQCSNASMGEIGSILLSPEDGGGKIGYGSSFDASNGNLSVVLHDFADYERASSLLSRYAAQNQADVEAYPPDRLELSIPYPEIFEDQRRATLELVKIAKHRLEILGVWESQIVVFRAAAQWRFRVFVPPDVDPIAVSDILNRVGRVGIHLIDDQMTMPLDTPARTALEQERGVVSVRVPGHTDAGASARVIPIFKDAELDGNAIRSVRKVKRDGHAALSLKLNFGESTEFPIPPGRRFAIVLDGEVLAAPYFREMTGNEVMISGSYSEADIDRFAVLLLAGSYPAKIVMVSEIFLEPSRVRAAN